MAQTPRCGCAFWPQRTNQHLRSPHSMFPVMSRRFSSKLISNENARPQPIEYTLVVSRSGVVHRRCRILRQAAARENCDAPNPSVERTMQRLPEFEATLGWLAADNRHDENWEERETRDIHKNSSGIVNDVAQGSVECVSRIEPSSRSLRTSRFPISPSIFHRPLCSSHHLHDRCQYTINGGTQLMEKFSPCALARTTTESHQAQESLSYLLPSLPYACRLGLRPRVFGRRKLEAHGEQCSDDDATIDRFLAG